MTTSIRRTIFCSNCSFDQQFRIFAPWQRQDTDIAMRKSTAVYHREF